jgi:signal transduction histidine kinase
MKVFSGLAARRPEAIDPKALKALGRQSDRLVSMINNLLDVSRLQLDRLSVELERVDLVELARDYCERYGALVEEWRLSCLVVEGAVVVNGDPARLEEVLSNLLDNAVKFSPKGSRITLGVGRNGPVAQLKVQDEGSGIAPEHLPRIFERFYKPTPQVPGLGVGLHVSKAIMERHGGRIWAESEGEGKGSTFYVELPLAD